MRLIPVAPTRYAFTLTYILGIRSCLITQRKIQPESQSKVASTSDQKYLLKMRKSTLVRVLVIATVLLVVVLWLGILNESGT